MKTRLWFWLAAVMVLAGCETADLGLRERFQPSPAVTDNLSASPEAVFAATLDFLPTMGFKVTRSRVGAGIIEGISRVQVAGDMRGARQTTVKIALNPTLEGETQIQVWMTEVIEDDYDKGPGLGTQTPLRDSALCKALVHGISRQLGLPEND